MASRQTQRLIGIPAGTAPRNALYQLTETALASPMQWVGADICGLRVDIYATSCSPTGYLTRIDGQMVSKDIVREAFPF